MLTRILIDNFRCFSNFEFRPTQHCLIIGENGTGKTTFSDALAIVRDIVATGNSVADFFGDDVNRHRSDLKQVIEIDASVGGEAYRYSITFDRTSKDRPTFVSSEQLSIGQGEKLLAFHDNELSVFGDHGEALYSFPAESGRAALSIFEPNDKTRKIGVFREWLIRSLQVRPDPRRFRNAVVEGERRIPGYEMDWFLSWYRHCLQEMPERHAEYLTAVKAALPGLKAIALQDLGPARKLFRLNYAEPGSQGYSLYFNELSDGQRMLLMLYALLHFAIAEGRSLVIDEPDNYVGLSEIQPWILEVDRLLPNEGQVICISHHPEMLSNFSLADIFHFREVSKGVVRAEPVPHPDDSGLTLTERVARGWLHA